MTEWVEPFSDVVVPGEELDWVWDDVELPTGVAWAATGKIRNSERSLDWTPTVTIVESGTAGLWELRVVLDAAATATFPAPSRATGHSLLYLDVTFDDGAGRIVPLLQYAVLQVRWTAI